MLGKVQDVDKEVQDVDKEVGTIYHLFVGKLEFMPLPGRMPRH